MFLNLSGRKTPTKISDLGAPDNLSLREDEKIVRSSTLFSIHCCTTSVYVITSLHMRAHQVTIKIYTSGKPSVAIIGAGISGMSAAYHLSATHSVTLFEAENRLGGHARTVLAGKNGDQPVDTGFIVFNKVNYPNLVRLFGELDVPIAKSDMSFAASLNNGALEYGLKTLDAIFAQRRNIANPKFLRMIRDLLRWNKQAEEAAKDPSITLRALCDQLKLGKEFREWYLGPMSGAIWSTPSQDILDFPALAFVQFFKNHALLSHKGQHLWYTVQGGSIEYVKRLEAALISGGVDIKLGTPIDAVRRTACGVEVKAQGGDWAAFDEVIFATHSDQTLKLLSDASPEEHANLAAVRYQPNTAVLHCDERVMPKRKKAWASWVYTEATEGKTEKIDLTYWMNSLQPIPKSDPLFVTLNSQQTIREELIYDEVEFAHPLYDLAMAGAVERIKASNGANNTWFCGAWMRNGFHEDGYASAMDVVEQLKTTKRLPIAAE